MLAAFNIEEELKKLPALPGVYIMHDKRDQIIYVGKAISLKNRVRQYFQSSRDKSVKIKQMVSKIARFEYIVTDSELEALVLENNLIKEHRPKYNTMLRDDKTYPYIKITAAEDYPRIMMVRRIQKDKAKYFGPFSSGGAVRVTIDLMHKAFGIRDCNRLLPRDIGKDRPCLYYHIHQCKAPCQGYVSKEEYRSYVDRCIEFLSGRFDPILDKVKADMLAASDKLDFESAAEYRDLYNSLLHVTQKQKISSEDSNDRDIIAYARDDKDAVVQVFFIREGKMVGREHHYIQLSVDDDANNILESFIKQFYSGTPFLPKELWVQSEIADAKLIEDWLSNKKGSRVRLVFPKKGDKEHLVELAIKNARMVLDKDRERIKLDEARSIGAVKEIEKLIGLFGIKRIEAYDISNISGEQSVGSMVVYEDGKPKKNDYRKFKIKTVLGPNDYASMQEVLGRRLKHTLESEDDKFSVFPDLILMDGGKGQVNVALAVLKELNLKIPVCGMVKDDNHRTRGLYYNNEELPIDTHSEGFKLITRIQDEAHRFAIEYHRSMRGKNQVKSILDDIPGIGEKRRKALLKHFKDIDKIRHASIEELRNVEGMNEAAAKAVREYFAKA